MIVRKSVMVNVPPDRAFRAFTDEIGQWWPLDKGFSFGGDLAKDMFMEGRQGGRLYERFSDGNEYLYGNVLAYEPPTRVVFSWPSEAAEPTEVEVRFTPEGESTRVDLEHRGFERLGEQAEKAFGEYDQGWVEVLGHFEKYAA
jgi:uncharacterized protein YndB with AHSA1/START domain